MNEFERAAAALARGVGSPSVDPRYVGGPSVSPRYVGAPAVQTPGGTQQPIDWQPGNYTAGDVSMFGLGTFVIPAGSIGTNCVRVPVNPITPQRLGCPSTVQGLLLLSAVIGSTNLFNSTFGIPIELFSEVSTFPQILWPTIDTNTGITLVVANPTGAPLNFSPTFYGTQVRR